jgi:PsbP-like protein
MSVMASLLFLTWVTADEFSFAQTGTQLDQTHTSAQCGISIKYPTNWIKEELNDKYDSLMALANFQPDGPDGPGNTVELEAWDISTYPDKSIEGLADLEKENIMLTPEASIEQSERTELGPNPAYEIIYNEPVPSGELWKIMIFMTVSGDMQYVVRYTATDPGTYGYYVSVIDSMIKSIKIEGGKKC